MTKPEAWKEQVIEDGLRSLKSRMGPIGWTWTLFLLAVIAVGVYAYIQQVRYGLVVTGMNDKYVWGLYITQFIFMVAVSLVAVIFSSILKLANYEFRRPLTRIAEFISVGAILFAPLAILVHTNHLETVFPLLLSIVGYGRVQSPIIWDVLVVNTYLIVCILLLYIPMIPDLAYCRDHLDGIPGWQKKLYQVLSLNWQGTEEQIAIWERARTVLILLIIPVAIAIRTVSSWLFAMTHRPGWDSTAFGAYFIAGAFVTGVASVIVLMFVLRYGFGLKRYITDRHFDITGKFLVLLSLIYLYFNISEFLVPAYKMGESEGVLLQLLFVGEFAPLFWTGMIVGVVVPAVVPIFKKGRSPGVLAVVGVAVLVAHWAERLAIVIPPMATPFSPIQVIPAEWQSYSATWEEWAVAMAILAGGLLTITILMRIFPVVPIYDLTKGAYREAAEGDGLELVADNHVVQEVKDV